MENHVELLCSGNYRFNFENGTFSRPYDNIRDGEAEISFRKQKAIISEKDYYNMLGEVYLLDIPYKIISEEVTDPKWIFSLVGEGRNEAHLEVSGKQTGPKIPSTRKEPLFV